MANLVGDIKSQGQCKRGVCLMVGQTTVNGAPTLPTQGVPMQPSGAMKIDDGANFQNRDALVSTLVIDNTAGTGAVVGTFVLWVYLTFSGVWYPIKVNGGTALAVYAAGNFILYMEKFNNLGHFDRVYLELQAPGGTGTPTFEAYLLTGTSGTSVV